MDSKCILLLLLFIIIVVRVGNCCNIVQEQHLFRMAEKRYFEMDSVAVAVLIVGRVRKYQYMLIFGK